ncbi:MAG: hypothetical protein DRN04_09685 [Thermoprotei archaeon]|nr:MAG: hypothetical protein DRN04_09685 [Thermoprotei archaeon]
MACIGRHFSICPVKGYIKQGYIVIAPRLRKSSSKSFVDNVSKVSTLIFYGFSLVTFIFSIINVNFTGLRMSVLLAKASWVTLVFTSVFLVSIK